MSRLGQYSNGLIERVSANLSGHNLAIVFAFSALGGVAVIFAFNRSVEQFVPLFDGRTFNRLEVERIEAALYGAQLEDFRFVDNRLEVAFDSRQQYVKVIKEGGVLANGFHGALSAALENSSILDSRRKTDLQHQLAIGNDAGKLLCRMSQIQNAFVQFVEEPLPGLHRRKKVTANVLVECKMGKRLTDENIHNIRSLVETIRPELSTSGITVTEFSDQKMTVHAAGDTVTEKKGLEKRVAIQQEYERHWERKIREAVDYISAARITVTAESTKATAENLTGPNKAEFRPTKLGVLINIPTSYYHRIWQAKASAAGMKANRLPTYDDLRRIRLQTEDKIASNVKTLTAAHFDSDVTVTSFADEFSSNSTIANDTTELRFVRLIGFIGVVLLVVLAFHFQSKRISKRKSAGGSIPHEPAWETGNLKVNSASTDELRRQISDVVRDDPATAARVLSDWMKKAG